MSALVARFGDRASALGVTVGRVLTVPEAAEAIARHAKEIDADPTLIAGELANAAPKLVAALEAANVVLKRAGEPSDSRDAAFGLSLARLAIAETGSVLLAEPSPNDRGVGMLVASHLVVCPTESLVASLDEAAPVLRDLAKRPGSGYATLVTGPSRTADIERVLTVGVQGPARLNVLFVDGLR